MLAHKSIVLTCTTFALRVSFKVASAGSMCKCGSRGEEQVVRTPTRCGKLQVAKGFLRNSGTDTPRETILA